MYIKARVPIVNFEMDHDGIDYEGDISVKSIASHNTKLLKFYSDFDERCKILGIFLKFIMKEKKLASNQNGFISSYAYVIMIIHYLQQVKGASHSRLCCLTSYLVLPLLQNSKESFFPTPRDSVTHIEGIEGSDFWFNSDIAQLNETFPIQNKSSVTELWVDFVDYYTNRFDYDNHVIQVRSHCFIMYNFYTVFQIRQLEPMTKKSKKFENKFSIEDPFELERDLGRNNIEKVTEILNGIENWSATLIEYMRRSVKASKREKKLKSKKMKSKRSEE